MFSLKKLSLTGIAMAIALAHSFMMPHYLEYFFETVDTTALMTSYAAVKVYASTALNVAQIYAYNQFPAGVMLHVNNLVFSLYSLGHTAFDFLQSLKALFFVLWSTLSLFDTLMTPIASPSTILTAKTLFCMLFTHSFGLIVGFVLTVLGFFF